MPLAADIRLLSIARSARRETCIQQGASF